MTTKETVTVEDLDQELARRDFAHFLDYVWIRDTDMASGPAFKFETWPHLLHMAEVFRKQKRIVVLKARQVGVSWFIAAYVLWSGSYHPGVNVLLLSMGELEAKELLGKVKFIRNHLPEPLREQLSVDSSTQMKFTRPDSSIMALPATENAGSGETATVVVQDEADKHEHLEKNFAAIRPTVDGGGQHLVVSSANYLKADSFFREQYRKASNLDEQGNSLNDGESTYVKLFVPWKARPSRDEEWYAQQKSDYSLDQLRKEYPTTESDALSAPSSISAFDAEMLDRMKSIQLPALDIPGAPAHAHIYEKFVPGRRYAAGGDTAHGVGKDFSVTAVLDVDRGSVVADVMTNQLDPEDFAAESVQLLGLYGNPIWGIEDNDWGGQTIKKAQQLGYKHLWHRPLSRIQPNKRGAVGWHTDEASRALLWGDCVAWVKHGRLVILSPEGLEQFYNVIWKPHKETGKLRIEAQQGANDDYPTAVGIAIQVAPQARRTVGVNAEDGVRPVGKQLVHAARRW